MDVGDWRLWACGAAMVVVAVMDTLLPPEILILSFLWVPVLASAAFSGPRGTAAVSGLGLTLNFVVGFSQGYSTTAVFWIRSVAMLLIALQQALSPRSLAASPITLVFRDGDGFKTVNTRHPHSGGDEVLRQVAQRLTACRRQEDVLARLGGDEFAALPDLQFPDRCRGARGPVACGSRNTFREAGRDHRGHHQCSHDHGCGLGPGAICARRSVAAVDADEERTKARDLIGPRPGIGVIGPAAAQPHMAGRQCGPSSAATGSRP